MESIEEFLILLWSYWPQENTLAVLLCGSWPLGMGCANVVHGKVTFLSDLDLMIIIDDTSELTLAHNAKLSIDSMLKTKAKEEGTNIKIDFSFVRFSDLPSKADTLFWFDSCSNALLIWGETNPLKQIVYPDRLNAREGIELLTNRALGQLFILPRLLSCSDDVQSALYHCGKVPVDGVNALLIIAGKYVPGTNMVNNVTDEVEIASSYRSSFMDIVDAANFWLTQKNDYDTQAILSIFGRLKPVEKPSLFGVWLWAAQIFHITWQIAMDMLLNDTKMERTTREVLIRRGNTGPIESMRSWARFLSSSSRHTVRASFVDRLRFSWRSTPISSARLCGVICLCWHPWGNQKEFQKGIKLVERVLPSTRGRNSNPMGKWVRLVDDSLSIWRVHVNSYDERTSTLYEYIDVLQKAGLATS